MSNEPYANAPTCPEKLTAANFRFSYKPPKPIAKITAFGCIRLTITDETEGFIKPTPEQIKNLKEMLCIDVELLEEEE